MQKRNALGGGSALSLLVSFTLTAGMIPSVAFAFETDAPEAIEENVDASLDSVDVVDWTQFGTCEWSIDSHGSLVFRPANGASEGTLADWSLGSELPWLGSHKVDIKSVSFQGTVHASITAWMFYGCSELTSVDLKGLDTSSVQNMACMFGECRSLKTVDLSCLDTSNATNLASLFLKCSALESVDLSTFKTSKVTDMGGMFSGCASLKSINLDGLDTSNVTLIYSMFNGCQSLTSLDLSGLDVSKVVDTSAMFSDCTSLSSLNLAGMNFSAARKVCHMFSGCTSLTSLDFSETNMPAAWNMGYMFEGCTSLRSIDLSGIGTSEATILDGMFSGCSSMTSLDLTNFNTVRTGYEVSADGMLKGCSSLKQISVGDKFMVANKVFPEPAGGKWVDKSTRVEYAVADIPTNQATTYVDSAAFPDVDYSQWYGWGVVFCGDKGLITGYGSGAKIGQFGVGDTLTRAQLAVILWRNAQPEAAAAYQGAADNTTGMSDVASNDYYTGAANWAVANKVINGSDDADGRHFNPNAPVTMEQLAVILANYADAAGAEAADQSSLSDFTDRDAISSWARGSVAWAKQKGLVSGYDNHDGTRTLNPQENVARERVATVLANAFEAGTLE